MTPTGSPADALANPRTDCWMWSGRLSHKGYGVVTRGHYNYQAYRVIWEAVVGPIPDGMWVLHKCDVKACVNPDHLYLGTHADNTRDAVERGRMAVGEAHGSARLTADDVKAIRASDGPAYRIAPLFGISKSTVNRIRNGELWRHV